MDLFQRSSEDKREMTLLSPSLEGFARFYMEICRSGENNKPSGIEGEGESDGGWYLKNL